MSSSSVDPQLSENRQRDRGSTHPTKIVVHSQLSIRYQSRIPNRPWRRREREAGAWDHREDLGPQRYQGGNDMLADSATPTAKRESAGELWNKRRNAVWEVAIW